MPASSRTEQQNPGTCLVFTDHSDGAEAFVAELGASWERVVPVFAESALRLDELSVGIRPDSDDDMAKLIEWAEQEFGDLDMVVHAWLAAPADAVRDMAELDTAMDLGLLSGQALVRELGLSLIHI